MNISYNWLKDLIEIDLPPAELGQELTRVGLAVEGIHQHGSDFVLDIDLTSNRPDCLSHLGIARELGVSTKKPLISEPDAKNEVPLPGVLAGEIVTIEEPELCHRFTARIIKNVKIGPSPQWLVDRLEAIGERAINNVADITNYVMHELGQPMHAFDLDKLAGGRIVVRRAYENDKLTTLDEGERDLDPSILVICDAEKPISIAGIMGGLDSSITLETVNVLLEVAYFDRASIRAASRKLNLASEASYHFERGVDVENLIRASNRAAELILELCGGSPSDLIDVYPTVTSAKMITSTDISASVKRLTGLDVDNAECVRILSSLGILPVGSADVDRGSCTFISPSWRHDIAIEEDLVEEIARHTGYENISVELPPAYGAGEYQANESREKHLRQALVDSGFDEAISYSFIDTKNDAIFGTVPGISDTQFVTLQDSVIEGAVRMRPSLLPGLLAAVRLNFNQQNRDLKLFEIGKGFSAPDGFDEPPHEQELFALVITGGEINEGRAMATRELDLYDAKGAIEMALDAVGAANVTFQSADCKHLRKGQTALIQVDGESVGYLGRISDEIAANNKFRPPIYVAEINLQTVLGSDPPIRLYSPLTKYPGITRDVSLIGKRSVEYGAIREAVLKQKVELCRRVEFVDVFEGKGIADDERSITIRLEYRSDDRTLVDSEVDALHQEIVEKLQSLLDLKLRT